LHIYSPKGDYEGTGYGLQVKQPPRDYSFVTNFVTKLLYEFLAYKFILRFRKVAARYSEIFEY